MSRAARAVAAGCLALLAGCQREAQGPQARAAAWLWAQQGSDGLLHSDVYGVLRRGESLTAAALAATAQLPAALRAPHETAMRRAFAALHRSAAGDPCPGPTDYPCYTAACHLHALALLAPPDWRAHADLRIAQLRALQFGGANGWARTDPVFGGFGLGDAPPQKPSGADHVTLSVTTAAIEALRAAGVAADDPMLADARAFVERCQRFGGDGDDGGFCGAPGGGVLGNKGGSDAAGRPHGYGTATADGVRALLACGSAPTSPRVRAAVAWLDAHAGDAVPGLLPEFEPSLRLYWTAALLQTTRALGRSAANGAFAQSRQRADGSCRGLAGAMKEDDPVVATTLALYGLPGH